MSPFASSPSLPVQQVYILFGLKAGRREGWAESMKEKWGKCRCVLFKCFSSSKDTVTVFKLIADKAVLCKLHGSSRSSQAMWTPKDIFWQRAVHSKMMCSGMSASRSVFWYVLPVLICRNAVNSSAKVITKQMDLTQITSIAYQTSSWSDYSLGHFGDNTMSSSFALANLCILVLEEIQIAVISMVVRSVVAEFNICLTSP